MMTCEESLQRHKFKRSFGIAKFVALVMLILCEYLFLNMPICTDDNGVASWILPYSAFGGTVVIALTFTAFIAKMPNCEVFIWTIIEFTTSLAVFIFMILACNVTLWSCTRPLGWCYFLPEIVGIIASTILLLHSFVWICMQRADQINDAVKKILV